MVKISILTVSYNSGNFLPEYFESLRKNKNSIEILIYDGESSDDTVKIIEEYRRKSYPITLFKGKNVGFAVANNFLAKHSKGKYLFILNPDTKLKNDCLNFLVNNPSKDEAILMPKQLYFDGSYISCGLGADIFGYPNRSEKIFYADGAAIFISKKIFFTLGMFDKNLFMFGEDIDLSWKAHLFGIPLIKEQKAIVFHYGGGSIEGGGQKDAVYTTNTFRRHLGERNSIANLYKNYSYVTLVWIFPIYILINLSEILFFLVLLKPSVSNCYIKAYRWFFQNQKKLYQKRQWIQKRRKVSDREIMKKMSKVSNKLIGLKRVGIPKIS